MSPIASIDWTAPFFDGMDSLYGIAVSVVVIYPLLVALIRLSGKRAVSKMNNFDWIVTVAVGSFAASAMAFDSVTIADAVMGIGLLLALQWGVTRLMTRSSGFTDLLISTPTLLLHKGELIDEALNRERVTEAEIFSSIRAAGLSDPADCYAVVLESNAEMTVIPRIPDAEREEGANPRPGGAMVDVPALADKAEAQIDS